MIHSTYVASRFRKYPILLSRDFITPEEDELRKSFDLLKYDIEYDIYDHTVPFFIKEYVINRKWGHILTYGKIIWLFSYEEIIFTEDYHIFSEDLRCNKKFYLPDNIIDLVNVLCY
jgi:hypothetical protein